MAYFKLEEPVRFHRYPFDFHSHFAGILPVESNSRWTRDRRVFRVGERQVSLEKGQELSLIGLLMSARGVAPDVDGKALEEARQAAHYELFELALQRMVRRNPFAATDRQGYLRGECAAENIYLACLILAQRFAGPRRQRPSTSQRSTSAPWNCSVRARFATARRTSSSATSTARSGAATSTRRSTTPTGPAAPSAIAIRANSPA